MNRLPLGMLSVAGMVWLGCSSASVTPPGGTGGVTGSTGGVTGSTGGVTGSTGGVTGSTGGVTGSTGGAAPGSGGVVAGSGGAGPGSGGAAPGSGGGAALECTGAATMNGYIDNGTLCGYAWTATNGAGETIEPPCGSGDCFMGATVCGNAEIPPNDPPAYTGAMIGWNVAQANGASTAGTWTSTGSGITVNYTATGATGVERVLVQSGGSDYCAVATPGVAMPWSAFAIECYNSPPGATFTVGSPVTAIAVQVNGDDAAAQSVELCLTSVTVNP